MRSRMAIDAQLHNSSTRCNESLPIFPNSYARSFTFKSLPAEGQRFSPSALASSSCQRAKMRTSPSGRSAIQRRLVWHGMKLAIARMALGHRPGSRTHPFHRQLPFRGSRRVDGQLLRTRTSGCLSPSSIRASSIFQESLRLNFGSLERQILCLATCQLEATNRLCRLIAHKFQIPYWVGGSEDTGVSVAVSTMTECLQGRSALSSPLRATLPYSLQMRDALKFPAYTRPKSCFKRARAFRTNYTEPESLGRSMP